MNRRKWLIQGSLAFTGLSILPFKGFAIPGYTSPEKPGNGPIILSFNENPYGPSPEARREMANAVNSSNRYPWEMINTLMSAIAVKNNVVKDNILVGAGSTEILDLCVQYAAAKKGSFVHAHPTFDRWAGAAERSGLEKIAIRLTTEKRHNLPAMLQAIRPDTQLVYICNPNNPTGTICERNALVSFIEEATKKALVVIDEAYLEYANETSVSSLAVKNKNLIAVKTFSKIYGLAGARAGYAIGHADTIEQLSELRCGADLGISVVSLAGALSSLKDEEFIKSSHAQNEEARKFATERLAALGIPSIPSHTNFIYFSLANFTKDFFARLKDNNILGTEIFEEQGKWSRITVSTMQEMEKFIAAIS